MPTQFPITLIFILSYSLSQASSAFSSPLQKVVTLSGGPGWYQAQQNQNVYPGYAVD